MKLLALCNDRLAIPALNHLLKSELLAGVGVSARETETHATIKLLCANHGVPVKHFRKNSFASDLEEWILETSPEAVLVKTFPWKIPAEVLDIPKQGFFNFHYAPLPAYRGANPLFWMMKDGIAETGVTVHQMTAEYDDGPILFNSNIPIHPQVTFGMLCTQLGFSALELTDRLLQTLRSGEINSISQDTSQAKWYNRPKPEDLWINWSNMDAAAVKRLVNACNPWNKGAPTQLNGWTIGISYATPLGKLPDVTLPGTILSLDERNGFCIVCSGNTVLRADVVYTEEGFMPGFALAGFGIKPGMVFSSTP